MKRKKAHYTPDYIVCPKCVEMLTRDDVEGFSRCPYCNHLFESEQELEEFLMQPIIEQWLRQSQSRPSLVAEDGQA